jgi:DNA polymerase-3 subunit alpha
MEKFAGYGFNKSHSAAYALVSYQTMWLKAHYPAEFMAAVLSADMDNTDKVVTLIDECHDMKLAVVPPSVNTSAYRFTVRAGGSGRPALSPHTAHPEHNGAIVYGLGAIKGVGEAAIEGIVSEREAKGPFKDLFDFCQRIDLKKANRRVLEALIRAGALDELGPNRATLMAALPQALAMAEQHLHNHQAGVQDLFGFDGGALQSSPARYETMAEWPEDVRLSGEKETLGLYLTGHPIDQYLDELKKFTTSRIVDLKPSRDQTVVVAGLIVAMRTMMTKRGDKMAFITLDDRSGRIELAVFSDVFPRFRDLIAKDRLIVVEGEVSLDDYTGAYKLRALHLYDIEQARERFAKRLVIGLDRRQAANGYLLNLSKVLAPFREGGCPIWVEYRNEQATARVQLGDGWRVRPTEELLNRLRQLNGEEQIRMEYA